MKAPRMTGQSVVLDFKSARAKEMKAVATDSRVWFAAMWDSINHKRATWASNPWVWVVGFKRVEPATVPR